MPQNRMRRGGILVTPYGVATFMSYREKDDMYRMKLPFAELYIPGESINPDAEDCSEINESNDRKAMEINEAYEALERMRQLNLGLACEELGTKEVDHDDCSSCVLERAKKAKATGSPARMRWMKRNKPDRCLTCGSPSCPKHASDVFLLEGITLCKECEKIFHVDFILNCMTLGADARRERIYHLMDLYDRTVLLLNYSKEYIPDVARAVEESVMRQNKINVGGSSAGIVSGVLGLAAAFTILTPAGPPLLIAALLFGGSSTVVQTGTELRKQYFFEPGKVADRILALHGMLLTILTVTGTLRDAALLDQDLSRFVDDKSSAAIELKKVYVENREQILEEAMETQSNAAIRIDRAMLAAAVAAEMKAKHLRKRGKMNAKSKSHISVVARNSRYMSRLTAGIMRTAQFAQYAGGALAAATLLIEARGMSNAIRSIRAGCCEKASTLRRIEQIMADFPVTADIEKECTAFLAFMKERTEMTHEEATQLLMEVSTKGENVEILQETKSGSEDDDDSDDDDDDSDSDFDEPINDDEFEAEDEGENISLAVTSIATSSLSPEEIENLPEAEYVDETKEPLSLSGSTNLPKENLAVQ